MPTEELAVDLEADPTLDVLGEPCLFDIAEHVVVAPHGVDRGFVIHAPDSARR